MTLLVVIYGKEEPSVSVHRTRRGARDTAFAFMRSLISPSRFSPADECTLRKLLRRRRDPEEALAFWNETVGDDDCLVKIEESKLLS